MDEEDYSVGSITKLLRQEQPNSVNAVSRKRKKSDNSDEKVADLFAKKPCGKNGRKRGKIDHPVKDAAAICPQHDKKQKSTEIDTSSIGTAAATVSVKTIRKKKALVTDFGDDNEREEKLSLLKTKSDTVTSDAKKKKSEASLINDDVPQSSAAAFRRQYQLNKQSVVVSDAQVDSVAVAEKLARTVYVGNLPVSVDRRALRRFFKFMLKSADSENGTCSRVESVRLRGAVPADPKTRKKLAVIHREMLHPERQSLCAYVVMNDVEAAKSAVKCCNGVILADRTLRVDMATPSRAVAGSTRKSTVPADSSKRCVFLGNLSFGVTEEAVRQHFKAADCGRIVNVRIVRDAATGMGRGFGYVEFADESCVQLALRLHLTLLHDKETGKGRPLRIHRCLRDRADQEIAKIRDKNSGLTRPQRFRTAESQTGRTNSSDKQARRRRIHLASNVPLDDARRNALAKQLKKRRHAKQLAKQKKKFDDFSPRALVSQSKRKGNSAVKKRKEKVKKQRSKTSKGHL